MLKSKNRLNFLEIEEVSGAADPAMPGGVGLRLAQARERAGYSLAEVAGYLRVRKNYLEAIEAERYDALPGRTYAIGFVRGYADLLGLDAARLVNEFKAETTALKGRTELVFPSPPPEGRIPGGAILFVSVLVALLAYGGWYYVSVTEKGVAELVPAVPERLVALLEGGRVATLAQEQEPSAGQAVAAIPRAEQPLLPAAGPGAPQDAAPASSAPASSAPASSAPAVPVPASARTIAPIAAAPAMIEPTVAPAVPAAVVPVVPPVDATDAPAAVSSEEERTPEPSRISGNSGDTDPVLAAREPGPSEGLAPSAVTPPTAPAVSVDVPVSAPVAVPAVAAASEPQTVASLPARDTASAGAGPGGVEPSDVGPSGVGPSGVGPGGVGPRIVLNATDEVWLQIRDGDSALVTRILRKGDSYRVPNRNGLTLLTGNAGALEILVDGKPAPTLGPLGAVRRDVALDPQSLLSGADARQ